MDTKDVVGLRRDEILGLYASRPTTTNTGARVIYCDAENGQVTIVTPATWYLHARVRVVQ